MSNFMDKLFFLNVSLYNSNKLIFFASLVNEFVVLTIIKKTTNICCLINNINSLVID